MNTPRTVALAVTFAMLSACAAKYTLVSPATVAVAKGGMKVTPAASWNRVPKGPFDVAWEENWTANGPSLDAVGFIGGLPDGQAVTRQRRKEDRQVPVFRATMSPQDLVSMIEAQYRIKAGASVFETRGVEPVTFLGRPGLRFDYAYVGGDEVKRFGRTVIAVIDGRLYAASLDAAALHYYGAALPEFDRMVAGATAG